MTHKEEIKNKVKEIVSKGKDVDEKIIEMVKNDFEQTIDDCKKTGISLKTATYETLEV